jgi:hypothetical protein
MIRGLLGFDFESSLLLVKKQYGSVSFLCSNFGYGTSMHRTSSEKVDTYRSYTCQFIQTDHNLVSTYVTPHPWNCPLHELASTLAHFTNWAILCSFSAHFMNWADFYVAFEGRCLASWYFCAQFVKWAEILPVHEMGNFTDGVQHIQRDCDHVAVYRHDINGVYRQIIILSVYGYKFSVMCV